MRDYVIMTDSCCDLPADLADQLRAVTKEQAAADVEQFLKTLADNNILDDGIVRGCTFVRMPRRKEES